MFYSCYRFNAFVSFCSDESFEAGSKKAKKRKIMRDPSAKTMSLPPGFDDKLNALRPPHGHPQMTPQLYHHLMQQRMLMMGPDRRPMMGPDGRPMMGPDGRPMMAPVGRPIMGPDGRPMMGPDGRPMMAPADGRPMMGPDGRPMMGPDGRPIMGPDGRPMMGPDGRPMMAPADGRPMMGPSGGRPMMGPDGRPMYPPRDASFRMPPPYPGQRPPHYRPGELSVSMAFLKIKSMYEECISTCIRRVIGGLVATYSYRCMYKSMLLTFTIHPVRRNENGLSWTLSSRRQTYGWTRWTTNDAWWKTDDG